METQATEQRQQLTLDGHQVTTTEQVNDNVQVAKSNDAEILQQKRTNWANLGASVHYLELELQTQCSQVIGAIKIPITIEDVQEAEEQLKALKKTRIEAETKRKTATTRLDAITARLMQPEKSLAEPESKLTVAIITVKKAHEVKLKQDQLRNDQLKQCRESLSNFNTKINSDAQQKVIDTVNSAYTYALGDGNITTEGLADFLTKCEAKITANSFPYVVPVNSYTLIGNEEYIQLSRELVFIDPQPLVIDYREKLKFKFSDYEIAVNNKLAALELARKEKEEADKKLAEEKQNAEIAAKLKASAETPVVNAAPVKALKSEYKIDMEETLESSILVMTAFVANIHLIRPLLRVNKFDSFNVGQMKTYLCKLKTSDENFSYTGINFKTIDKL